MDQSKYSKDHFLTSTNVGHHLRPGYYFPSSNLKPHLYDPLPHALNEKDEVQPETHFKTTNKEYHDVKFKDPDNANGQRQVKPMDMNRVNYIYDVAEKLNSKPRRPLTMAFQQSEYKDNYLNDEPSEKFIRHETTQLFTEINIDERNIPREKHFSQYDGGVLDLLNPYVTSYQKEYRPKKKF